MSPSMKARVSGAWQDVAIPGMHAKISGSFEDLSGLSYRDQVLAHPGLVEVYPFNSPIGSGFYGLKNGVNATYRIGRSGSIDSNAGVTLVQGEPGAAVSTATSDSLVSDSTSPWDGDRASIWAMECWFKSSASQAAYRAVMALDNGGSGVGRLLYASSSGSPIGNGKAWIWANNVNLQGKKAFIDGSVHHLVLKRRATGAGIPGNLDVLFYIDGVVDVLATNPGTPTGADNLILLESFSAGSAIAWAAYYGLTAELTEEQIRDHYVAGGGTINRFTTNLTVDNFTGSAGSIAGRATSGGQTWTVHAGTISLNGSGGVVGDNVTSLQNATVDAGVADHAAVATWGASLPASGKNMGICARYVDQSNYIRFVWDPASSGEIALQKVVGGVVSTLSSRSPVTGTTYIANAEIRLECRGPRIVAYIGGQPMLSGYVTDAVLLSATRAGVNFNQAAVPLADFAVKV